MPSAPHLTWCSAPILSCLLHSHPPAMSKHPPCTDCPSQFVPVLVLLKGYNSNESLNDHCSNIRQVTVVEGLCTPTVTTTLSAHYQTHSKGEETVIALGGKALPVASIGTIPLALSHWLERLF
ncbi:L-2-hydroxyglutarate dehydrogenase, mitochondrial [Platysternon megacephalum]|uniref:L-2-hydroxyglutarate dehydrogenase, mitochondrial n=1 Tax=Platysternon megacephalum TaxID=55544 RepID=A0A4D9E8T2_9SAUR|nr:L-2-hydroxyglutarate dehydrogenase, mitochondrial [Platysternon megacephalum]